VALGDCVELLVEAAVEAAAMVGMVFMPGSVQRKDGGTDQIGLTMSCLNL
jgi:hypothetical protein